MQKLSVDVHRSQLAFPSTPHVCLLESLKILGAPTHIVWIVESIYILSMSFPTGDIYGREGCSVESTEKPFAPMRERWSFTLTRLHFAFGRVIIVLLGAHILVVPL